MNITVNNRPIQSDLNIKKNFISQPQQTPTPSFTGVNTDVVKVASKSKYLAPLKKAFAPVSRKIAKVELAVTGGIAKITSKLLKTQAVKKLVYKTEKTNVVNHLQAAIGVIISGLYIYKTMTNDKLESDKRMTLSINQGIVSVVATTMGYTVDGLLANQVGKFSRKFAAVNHDLNPDKLKILRGGIKAAASMMIFGTMYRYVAPVLVTPIANSIGNGVHEANKAKKALAKAAAAGNTAPSQTQKQAPAQKTPESIFSAKSPFSTATN